MDINNRLTDKLQIQFPIIQAGMIWVSGWKLASAVSNCGGLGLIGAGSMKPELLREHIKKCKAATTKSFGVNIPLMREDASKLIDVVVEENVKIVFSSAGNPAKFIDILKKNNIIVVHVVPSVKHGLKAENIGCDAIVGEGVEAGGHNGIDEITTFCLIPQLVNVVKIPVIAAGGIACGKQIAAAFCLGAEAVQLGTRFATTFESSAHQNYKNAVINSKDNDTVLAFKKIGLVRMIKNDFAYRALESDLQNWSKENQLELLGKKREMRGIFDGDLSEGMLEAGQSSGLINEVLSVEQVFKKLLLEFSDVRQFNK